VIHIRCAKCRAKIMRYNKIGRGRVLKCWTSRIGQLHGVIEDDVLKCRRCGHAIGTVAQGCIRMKQSAFTYGGRVVK